MQVRNRKRIIRLTIGLSVVVIVGMVVLTIVMFRGCGLAKEIDMDSVSTELVAVLNSKDAEALEAMLSPRAVREEPSIVTDASELLLLIDGEISDYDYKGRQIESRSEPGKSSALRWGYIDVRTTAKKEYRIYIGYEIIQRGNKDERGIYSLYAESR